MASFRASTSLASPLLIQLGTAATIGAEVREWSAQGETTTGATSLPVLTRPSTPGTSLLSRETADVVCLSFPPQTPNTTALSRFSTQPSFPEVALASNNLPIQVEARYPAGRGVVIPPNTFLMLFAKTNFPFEPEDPVRQHTWSAGITWEEL